MMIHYPKLYNMTHALCLCVLSMLPKELTILYVINTAGVVPCDGPKKPPVHHP